MYLIKLIDVFIIVILIDFILPIQKILGNCPASLTVRIIECNDNLHLQNRDNSTMFIGHKAIIVFNHCHNHIIDGHFLEKCSV